MKKITESPIPVNVRGMSLEKYHYDVIHSYIQEYTSQQLDQRCTDLLIPMSQVQIQLWDKGTSYSNETVKLRPHVAAGVAHKRIFMSIVVVTFKWTEDIGSDSSVGRAPD